MMQQGLPEVAWQRKVTLLAQSSLNAITFLISSFRPATMSTHLMLGGCREPDEPHQLHFDLREAALRQGLQKYSLEHPVSLIALYRLL